MHLSLHKGARMEVSANFSHGPFNLTQRDKEESVGSIRPRVSVRREVGPACADVWRGGGSTCADVWRTGWSACADVWQMCNAVFFFPLCIFEHLTGRKPPR